MNTQTENKTIVAFHIGRGGRFNNQGFRTFTGVYDIQEIMNMRAESRWHFDRNRDEQGRFCTPHYVDCNGNFLIDIKDVASGIGRLDWDGDYDTDYTKYAEDVSEAEAELIFAEAQMFDGRYVWNYPIDEIIQDISSHTITRAAEKGLLSELYQASISCNYSEEDFIAEYLEEELHQH